MIIEKDLSNDVFNLLPLDHAWVVVEIVIFCHLNFYGTIRKVSF